LGVVSGIGDSCPEPALSVGNLTTHILCIGCWHFPCTAPIEAPAHQLVTLPLRIALLVTAHAHLKLQWATYHSLLHGCQFQQVRSLLPAAEGTTQRSLMCAWCYVQQAAGAFLEYKHTFGAICCCSHTLSAVPSRECINSAVTDVHVHL
jgi:hypothetical protein